MLSVILLSVNVYRAETVSHGVTIFSLHEYKLLGIFYTMNRLTGAGSYPRVAILFLAFVASVLLFAKPVYAQGVVLPSFGQGKVAVRVYTDYFCAPCRAGEPKIEALLKDLVKRNKIKLTFIDTPGHPETPLYARYFLFIVNYKKDFEHVLYSRAALFDAATIKINTREKLEEFLGHKGIQYKPFEAKQTLNAMNIYLTDDGVKGTPTVVIDNGTQKQQVSGVENIIKALELLK
jgi:thiol:disulfide interchange protein DsbA